MSVSPRDDKPRSGSTSSEKFRAAVRMVMAAGRIRKGISFQGVLNKKGEIHGRYEQRYFVLKGSELRYFKFKGDSCLGRIDLHGAIIQRDANVEFGFSIHGKYNKRIYELTANSEIERTQWMKELELCVVEASTTSKVHHEGYLKKRNPFGKWDKRYFVLNGPNIYYYTDDSLGTLKGNIDIRFGKIEQGEGPGGFTVEGPHASRKYILQADDENIKAEWIKLTTTSIQNHAREDPEASECLQSFSQETTMEDSSKVKNCRGCAQGFTLTRRRHNCQSCGKTFCTHCVCWRAILPVSTSRGEQPVCAKCYKSITGNPIQGHCIASWISHTDSVQHIISVGGYIYSSSFDCTVKIWTPDGKLHKTLTGHVQPVSSLTFASCQLWSASGDGTLRTWDTTYGASLNSIDTQEPIWSILLWDDFLVTGHNSGRIAIWTQQGHLKAVLHGHTDVVRSLVVFNEHLCSASEDRSIKKWTKTFQCADTWMTKKQFMSCLVVFMNSLWTGSEDGNITRRDPKGNEIACLKGHSDAVWSMLPTTNFLFSSSADRTIKQWDLNGKCVATLKGHDEGVTTLALSQGYLLSGSDDKLIKVWDIGDSAL